MAYTETFGVPAIPVRSGGSIPIVALFEKNWNQNHPHGIWSRQRHSLAKRTLRDLQLPKESKPYRCFAKYFVELSK
jgi:hypothetical protein